MIKELSADLRSLKNDVALVLNGFAHLDGHEVVEILSLIIVMLTVGEFWYLKIPTTILCIWGLIQSGLRKNSAFWFLLICFIASSHYQNWYSIDNHKYLLLYWCLVLWMKTFIHGDPLCFLRLNGKVMLSLCVGISVLWKVGNPNYMDGSFFHYTLLTDERFRNFASVIGGMGGRDFDQNLLSLSYAKDTAGGAAVLLQSSEAICTLAQFMTWWTIAIESLIAVAFALPTGKWVDRMRHVSLCFFCISTYSVATVVGFGWLLIVMALATCREDQRNVRVCYYLIFGLLQFYTMPLYELFSHVTN